MVWVRLTDNDRSIIGRECLCKKKEPARDRKRLIAPDPDPASSTQSPLFTSIIISMALASCREMRERSESCVFCKAVSALLWVTWAGLRTSDLRDKSGTSDQKVVRLHPRTFREPWTSGFYANVYRIRAYFWISNSRTSFHKQRELFETGSADEHREPQAGA